MTRTAAKQIDVLKYLVREAESSLYAIVGFIASQPELIDSEAREALRALATASRFLTRALEAIEPKGERDDPRA